MECLTLHHTSKFHLSTLAADKFFDRYRVPFVASSGEVVLPRRQAQQTPHWELKTQGVDGPKASKTRPNPGRSTDHAFQSVASYEGTSISITEGKLMLFKDLHPKKALSPMYSTESGMSMLSKDKHSAKAPYSMLVTELGMLMLSKDLHPSKTANPMCVSESGILMFFKKLHPAKA